ncbi:MAG: transcriptional repressor [Chloroflexi bacterium]|nr:transcriptional repressor [Chloroflexota bacterium]
MIMNQRANLMAVLGERGYRITVPRVMIARLIEQKREGFTAQALCEELPSVGRATVFRTLKLFLEAGMLCKLDSLGGAPIYSLCERGHHHHSVCVVCGAVEEFRLATVERLMRAISNDAPGQTIGHRIELYVDCLYANCEICPRNSRN